MNIPTHRASTHSGEMLLADFWLNLQIRWDLYRSLKLKVEEIKTIQPLAS